MKLLKETLTDAVVLTLKGEFDSFVTNAFGGEIQKVFDDGIHNIVLNMRLVKFVNSTALGAMIKARKGCKAGHGDLVVSQPSAAVREAMQSLGLDRLFSIYEDDEEAVGALGQSSTVEMQGAEESTVMISIPGETGVVVGRLKRLDVDAIECRVDKAVDKFVHGRQVELKFRLPLYRKEYFELKARVESCDANDNGAVVGMHFTEVSDDDRADIETFVDDMGELRKAARGG